ncbi:DUF1496 domain-containing protein [Arsukibacterium sp.]|uniref:DUF1496 domain-containing protein n=1 Tax=Arsukibacterium sp. TaxID=1977258 RepID=UPI002FDAE812
MIKKTLIFIAFFLCSAGSFAAEQNKSDSVEIDFKKFCYYQDQAFSEGARLKQQGQIMQCARNEKGSLYWVKIKD